MNGSVIPPRVVRSVLVCPLEEWETQSLPRLGNRIREILMRSEFGLKTSDKVLGERYVSLDKLEETFDDSEMIANYQSNFVGLFARDTSAMRND